ncbi:receptor-interacting serine/threonine-protein kinase 3-like [Notolabrus celidotus]|uniref:receptor-interacting serine/threonine-protein kinase 3-like n=1 Tax=Notolabrus celidotus TaxID=1203425 RepID=UPI00148F592E|nr:receptor-interacting serine/threonine-protein kinase 3-like [Notolabrus celidotus]XP_034541435.1 receptor-interacting serine/threonine-protein kinase 3-like [Notolabrus celidotus]
MALLSHKNTPIVYESLENWEFVGSGGFGRVYKAIHKEWGFHVAIKKLHDGVSLSKERALCEEANHMENASCEFVLRVYGIYQGPSGHELPLEQGIVMEFMGIGSVESLLEDLGGPPPWPLVFRLVHQVALGMNFLHSRKLMHQDLKPSNVLLNDDLNAKLADFGLCRVSASASCRNGEKAGASGGSYKYMPPEAFNPSYEPVRDFDSYSYGILLWSIFTGKEPYPAADFSRVELRIPLGDRPPFGDIDQQKAEGLKELVDLMRRCWDQVPSKRPDFKVCLEETKKVFSIHKMEVHIVVHQVLTTLKSSTSNTHQNRNGALCVPLLTPEQPKSHDSIDCRLMETKSTSMQSSVSVSTKRMSIAEKAKFVDDNRPELIQVISEVMAITEELGDMVHNETYQRIEAEPTSTEKIRVLYQRTLRSGGEKVKAAFFDALKKHHPRLVERLGG